MSSGGYQVVISVEQMPCAGHDTPHFIAGIRVGRVLLNFKKQTAGWFPLRSALPERINSDVNKKRKAPKFT